MKRAPVIPAPRRAGFTLVELMVSMVVITLLLLVLVSITNSVGKTWSMATSKIEAFREARTAFESVTRRLSQATLNTYWGYAYPNNSGGTPDASGVPTAYVRQSELRFLAGQASTLLSGTNSPSHAVFFQAPLGFVSDQTKYGQLENLLNTSGYFIEFGSDSAFRPPFLNELNPPVRPRYRFRLMEFLEPSEKLTLYKYTTPFTTPPPKYDVNPGYVGHEWFTGPLAATPRPVRAVAENIVALILVPRLTPQEDSTGAKLAPTYDYDSTSGKADASINPKNQLPPVIQVTMVSVDEKSFDRLQGKSTTMPDFGLLGLFQQVGDLQKDDTFPGYVHDLQVLQQNLQARKLGYRVFTTNVSLRAAKWSREQKNL